MIYMVKYMKKRLIKVITVLIIAAFAIISYYTYQSYYDKSQNNEIDNFYNTEYLYNNNYITSPNKLENFKNDDLSFVLDESNILYIKSKKEKINIKTHGLPTESLVIYYSLVTENTYEFIAKTDSNNLYYCVLDLYKNSKNKFTMIGKNIKDIYVINSKETDLIKTSSFIIVDQDNNFKYIDYVDNNYVLKDDIEKVKPYFDYLCKDELCKDFIVYISFNKELIYKDKTIVDQDNNTIYIKDIFSILEIDNKNKTEIKDYKKHKYTYLIYIIDNNGKLYVMTLDNENYEIKQLETKGDVKDIVYETKNEEIVKIKIIYGNGNIDVFEKGVNKYLINSTLNK